MKKIFWVTILLVVSLAGQQAFAISKASSDALNAFRRYEPDFSNSLRRLQELDRKVENQNIPLDSERFAAIRDEAADIMDYVQKRYDLMEDLFSTVSGDYPNDRAELFEGFSRIDDLYREARDFNLERFVNVNTHGSRTPVEKKTLESATDPAKTEPDKVEEPVSGDSGSKKRAKNVPQKGRVEVSGVLKLDFRNRNEVYRTQSNAAPFVTTETALPNNLGQGKLSLTYKFDEKRQLYIEDRYLRRERNEPVHENYLTLSYMMKVDKSKAWTIKDTLHHSWYPDAGIKDYRDNLIEVFYNDRWHQRERLANIGYQNRVYPRYTRSDYHQMNLSDQETWFIDNGNIFAEVKGNWRRYRNVADLDYDNFNLYTEYNKTYAGNKADLSVSNTYDRRMYDKESVNLYRASYFDDYFRVNYDLPVHDKLSYLFEGQYQKRSYLADEPRGYAQLDVFTAARLKFNKNTKGQVDYRYIYNDENTRFRAHKNHKLHGMWQKKINDRFKVRIDDTYHLRRSVEGEVMDFRQNSFNAKLSWILNSGIALTWNSEYLARIYDQIVYRDYKYFQSGLQFSYAEAQKYDWKVEQAWRKFSFRNGNNISTGWESEAQPFTQVKYNVALNDDLKLKLRASWEKSFYRAFDTRSQELLWDFTKPMTITEFYGGLEYEF
ncbi:MAG: hypothetical protein Kow0029_02900 [Candidatus Rifleibacteriota bacterium]